MHYYNIVVGGYGAEVCWHPLSEECYNYYKENGEKLMEHILEENNDVPDYANLRENGSKTWDELDGITREYYCGFYASHISIMETDKHGKYMSDFLECMELEEFANTHDCKINNQETETTKEKYCLQIYSAEKGSFWDCSIISEEPLDLSKFTFCIQETITEEDTMLMDILYNGVSLDNGGEDTRGKGIDVNLIAF